MKNKVAKRAPAKQKVAKRVPRSGSDAFAIEGVRISNPDRVVYPDQGITKRILAEYYVEVAEWVLPHIVDRPLTVIRCPAGQGKPCFYQKHVSEGLPDAVSSVKVAEGEGDYIMIRDLAGLIALIQMGSLELHPWGSRADDLERPDRLIFDLDPAPEVTWEAVVQGARDIRALLKRDGLRSFVRTSGGKGLHVVVPITPKADWATAKAYTQRISQELVRAQPGKYLAQASKAKRVGKVFVDYLRNGRGATAVASYSTRAKPGAPVSTPISWDELDSDIRADTFNIVTVVQRLWKLRSDPWKELGKVKQLLPTLRAVPARGR